MSTTLLFVELLIIGVQVFIWLSLLVLDVFGLNWLFNIQISGIENWTAIILVFLLSIVYIFGIIIDRFSDFIFNGWDKYIAKCIFPNPNKPLNAIRYEIGKENEFINNLFEYTRSRIRIMRASSVNFLLTTIFGILYVKINIISYPGGTNFIFFLFISGLFLVGLSIFSWHKLVRSFYDLIKSNYYLTKNQTRVYRIRKKTANVI